MSNDWSEGMPVGSAASEQRRSAPTVAYIMSRFPKISETFILYEILELERLGLRVEVFPLLREQTGVVHEEARAFVDRAHFNTLFSRATLAAQLYWLARSPKRYLKAWFNALRGNVSSPRFLYRALVVVPQAALFARQMRELGVSHVHAHWATHPALAAYTVRELTGLPYSFTAHAHDIYVDRTMLREKIHEAEFVVTISDYNRRMLHDLSPGDAPKIHVVHCGVDVSTFQPGDHASGDRFTILSIASLEEKKGHRYLVDACSILRAAGLTFRCVLIGDGPERSRIRDHITRIGLSSSVEVLGARPREEVLSWLQRADVVVLASITTNSGKQEGIPVALMEAMAAERAVVATAISGIPELITHNESGVLVPERDSAALATAVYELCEDPTTRRQLGAAARARVMEEFNLQTSAQELVRLIVGSPTVSPVGQEVDEAVDLLAEHR